MFKENKAQALADRFHLDIKAKKVTKMSIAQFLSTKTKYSTSTILGMNYEIIIALLEQVYPDL